MQRYLAYLLLILAASLLLPSNARTNEPSFLQDALANAIIQIPKYAILPNKSNSQPVLCIDAGQDFIKKVTRRNESSKTFSYITGMEDLSTCDVVYIETKKTAQDILLSKHTGNLLTIARYRTFIDEGGVLNLIDNNGKLSIGINLSAARANQITLSAALIELATRVIQ